MKDENLGKFPGSMLSCFLPRTIVNWINLRNIALIAKGMLQNGVCGMVAFMTVEKNVRDYL